MEAFHQACALNNMGVSLFESGERYKCVAAFQRGLTAMKQAALPLDKSPGQDRMACTYPLEEGTASQEVLFPANDCIYQSSSCDTDSSFVLNLPFFLEDDVEDERATVPDTSRIPLYSATLLFNLALSFHEQGRKGKGSLLKKALLLYRLSLQLLQDCERATANTSLLQVVAMNNLANCHYELCEYALSQNCAAELTNVLYGFRTRNKVENTLSPALVDILLLNSTLICENTPTVAHAA